MARPAWQCDVQVPEGERIYETVNSSSPRRTSKIKFTCGRCGATSIKPVNPHAWTAGSVFAKCGKCNITHKVGGARGVGGRWGGWVSPSNPVRVRHGCLLFEAASLRCWLLVPHPPHPQLIDNLKLFHELSGPVFPAAAPANDALLSEQLPPSMRLRLDEADPHQQ